jgi:flagella basal body P-ring formation protein FlgA
MKVLFVLLILIMATAEAKISDVRLRSWTMVNPGTIALSDFLEPYAPEELKVLFSKVTLGQAPGPDQKLIFTSQFVSSALSKNQSHPGYRLVIPTRLVAEGRGLFSSLKNAKYLFEADLEQKCFSLCRIDVTGWEPPKVLKNEPKTSYFQYSGLSMSQFPKKTFNQNLTLKRISGDDELVWLQGQVSAMMEAAVAKRFLQAGWKIEDQDIEVQEVEFGQTNDTPASKESLVGKKLGRSVGPGNILTAGVLERDFDVRFGQSVRGVIVSDSWKVTFEGTARDNGSVGDRIKIFNPTTKKLLSGILQEKNMVEIK